MPTVDYKLILSYYKHKYNKSVNLVQIQNDKTILPNTKCPKYVTPHEYIYHKNSSKSQFKAFMLYLKKLIT